MKAVILAGGLGTRLRPLTDNLPKPVVPLGNRPFAEYQIDILKRAGVDEVTFSLGYQSEKIEQTLGDGGRFGIRLNYMTEPEPLGTAGAFAFANRNSDDSVFVLNGDILTDVNLEAMIEIHRSREAVATLFLKEVSDPTLYGLVDVDESGKVTGFREKPSAEEASKIERPLISAGIYLLEPSVSEMIPPNVKYMFEHDVFPTLITRGFQVASYAPECYWRDIGTIENYRLGNIDSMRPPFGDCEKRLIGERCAIAETAKISESVVGDDVRIGELSVVSQSVIQNGSVIGERCRIESSVIGRDCIIGNGIYLKPGTVVADGTEISER
jgi:NDP-sugar pyrophosphorylase family protein